ncbi:MAG: hypothetical protein ACOZCK_06525, partial [Pseudomonadota bacterium]
MTFGIANRNLGIFIPAFVVGWYSSTFFFLLLLPSLLIYWLAKKFLPADAAIYAFSIAVQSAQVFVGPVFMVVLISRMQAPINLIGLMVDTVVPVAVNRPGTSRRSEALNLGKRRSHEQQALPGRIQDRGGQASHGTR